MFIGNDEQFEILSNSIVDADEEFPFDACRSSIIQQCETWIRTMIRMMLFKHVKHFTTHFFSRSLWASLSFPSNSFLLIRRLLFLLLLLLFFLHYRKKRELRKDDESIELFDE